ncbi:MAG: sensor domain-containing diguanylate cyclase [Desulfofustis sp.]|jgi:diguanylate cyclase (GGDEF)-like protein/PAS domain S-box-containing protein
MTGQGSDRLEMRIRELEQELEDLRINCKKQIEKSLSRYKRVIDSTSEGYLELDRYSKVTSCNETFLKLLGKDRQEVINQPIESLYAQDSVFVHFANRHHLNFEAEFFKEGGGTIPLLCKRSMIRDQDDDPIGHFVFLTDLTEIKSTLDDLQQAQSRYRTMYRNAVQGMYQCTLDGRLLRANPAFAAFFGFDSTSELLSHPGGLQGFYKNVAERQLLIEALKKQYVVRNFEVEMVRPDGRTVWALINARLAEGTDGQTFIEGIIIDNTEKREAEEKLRKSRERFRYLANHDSLTDLFNTRYLYKALDMLIAQSRRSGKPFSLVFLDMDNFKQIVDTHGHLNGSQALREVARTFRENLADPAFGVAYGGDEFVLVLPDTGKDEALEQARRIRARMKETTYLTGKGLEVHMSASFGLATYPDDAQDRESLLALADEAMFRIKSRGKDAVGITPDGKSATDDLE